MPDNHEFLFGLQTRGWCDDWLPWSQTKYAKEVLHGDLPTKSPHAGGVCNVVCAYVLGRWLETKTFTTTPIVELEREATAVWVDDLARTPEGSDAKFFDGYLTRKGFPTGVEVLARSSTGHVAYPTTGCGIGLYPALDAKSKGAHRIIASGLNFALFDPNVGYMKCKNQVSFVQATDLLIATWYPELPNKVVTVHNIS